MTSEPEVEFIRRYELRLLHCTLPPSIPPPSNEFHSSHPLHVPLNHLLSLIEAGNYSQALSSDAAKLVLKLTDVSSYSFTNSVECADQVYSEFLSRVGSVILDEAEDGRDRAYRVMVVMCVAVAAFLGFTQCNITGPMEKFPKCPLAIMDLRGEELVEWDCWARNQLMSAGSELLGKFSNLQYTVFAKMLLTKTKDLLFGESVSSIYGIKSITWWLARITFVQQRILAERSSALFDQLQVLMSEALHHFGSFENVTSYWGANLPEAEALPIVSMVHLEAGIMEHHYARIDPCRLHFEAAEVAAGVQLSVTGVLGFRTVHQVEPKAQMVLVANTNSSECVPSNQAHDPNIEKDNLHLHELEISEGSDVLIKPKLLDNGTGTVSGSTGIPNGATVTPTLTTIQQAVILAKCLLIERSSRQDEMQRWDMAPYIEAIDSQQSPYFMIERFCNILRVRWESSRSRTKERSLLMMEKLVQGVTEDYPGAAQRVLLCYGVYIPTIPALQKEYGELLVRCGLIGEAGQIFEKLELWDSLIFCYRLMEKKAAAVELIKKRLSEMPNDPRLWCSLGDVTNNDSCYEKALEVSNNRSARAKRSLARSAYNRGDYETSKVLWESAMALNSLFPDGWFALGAAALKARDVEKALDGFSRTVQLDPENGEAWNNIACLHMIKKRSKESFVAFKEALKFKRSSWQLWENFGHVAMDVGNVGQALEAIHMVLDLTSNKRVDSELLERIMVEVERRAGMHHSVSPSMIDDPYSTEQHGSPVDSSEISSNGTILAESYKVGNIRETEQLIELLGKVLQQIVRVACIADIWGIYARWHRIKGDLTMCSEALLKQVRSYQGSDLWKDEARFKKFSQASLELCKVYMELSSSTGSQRELSAAEMHLKSTLRQGHSFSDMQEFRDLQTCLDVIGQKKAL